MHLNMKFRSKNDNFRPIKRFLAEFAYVGSSIAVYSLVLTQC